MIFLTKDLINTKDDKTILKKYLEAKNDGENTQPGHTLKIVFFVYSILF